MLLAASGTVTIAVPGLALGIVVIGALVYGLLSALDRIPMRRFYPPDPYREPLPDYERRPAPPQIRGELVEPPLRVDLDRIPPAQLIKRAGHELDRRESP